MTSLKLERVHIQLRRKKHGQWKFQSQSFSGTLYEYRVTDENFDKLNQWTFVVRVPKKFLKFSYITVQPIQTPQRKCWAGIERRSINFGRGTLSHYRTSAYAKVTLADADGSKNKVGVSFSVRNALPQWMSGFKFRRKQTVTATRAGDGNALAAVVDRDDHEAMIKLFLATKAWVLYTGFSISEAGR